MANITFSPKKARKWGSVTNLTAMRNMVSQKKGREQRPITPDNDQNENNGDQHGNQYTINGGGKPN